MFVEDESCPVYDTDNEEEESMPVYDTDIEDVTEEEELFVRKGGFGGEEDNIKDVVFVANDLCSSMIQTILSVDFEEGINTKSHELMSFGKSIIIKVSQSSFKFLICKNYQEWYLKAPPMVDKLGFKTIKVRGSMVKRLMKPLDELEREFRRLRRAAWRLQQNESLAIAGRNLFDVEASASNNIRTKPPMVKDKQEKNKIGTKPDKNGKRGKAWQLSHSTFPESVTCFADYSLSPGLTVSSICSHDAGHDLLPYFPESANLSDGARCVCPYGILLRSYQSNSPPYGSP
nr:hypothetical protein [Tanacetum cinerariifolium]